MSTCQASLIELREEKLPFAFHLSDPDPLQILHMTQAVILVASGHELADVCAKMREPDAGPVLWPASFKEEATGFGHFTFYDDMKGAIGAKERDVLTKQVKRLFQ